MRDEAQISLANASSVMLPSSSRDRKRRMKHHYIIEYKGAKVTCETSQAATELLRSLGEDSRNPLVIPWTPDEFSDFTGRIGLRQRRLLALLLKKGPRSVTDAEIREALSIAGNKALAGCLSGISKVALMFGIDPRRVYHQSTEYKQGKPERRYWLTPAFTTQARNMDWPSESDLEEELDELKE